MDDLERSERRWQKRKLFRGRRSTSGFGWVLTGLLVVAVLTVVLAWPDVGGAVSSWLAVGD